MRLSGEKLRKMFPSFQVSKLQCFKVSKRRGLEKRPLDRKSTRLNSSPGYISYAVFCLKTKRPIRQPTPSTRPLQPSQIPPTVGNFPSPLRRAQQLTLHRQSTHPPRALLDGAHTSALRD